jgi:hypothetical protein
VNTKVQGSAADLLKLKLPLIRLHDRLPGDASMLLPVHDSILVELPTDLVEETWWGGVAAMEAVPAGFTDNQVIQFPLFARAVESVNKHHVTGLLPVGGPFLLADVIDVRAHADLLFFLRQFGSGSDNNGPKLD